MFETLLIANRGEIACRVIATARRMGLRTVAVYSSADEGARHVALADAAVWIGPAPARESYLCGEAIIEAARRESAQAIHPGYGFLSENAEFAERCAAAGVVFVGPPPAAMRAMGGKSAAKALMQRAGVALVPGYHGEDQAPETLLNAARDIGYPVLLKASAGGGGRGMRVVESEAEFAENWARARGEARAAFGDDRLLVEKYLTHPRHIEVQVFADMHGTIVSLFERDCSVQRRHQKVVEEAPAPLVDAAMREGLSRAAIAAARAVNYVGAGTVEFIHQDGEFYFMEMNTRLQVEHPVTEFVTGLDLVEWQLRVAAGEVLPADFVPAMPRGHAIEVRVCAEDPARDFMPATGRISLLEEPVADAHVRVDGGVRVGDAVTAHYDSLLGKLIVWDVDRDAALSRLRGALDAYRLLGVRTNLALLRGIAADEEFALGAVDTGYIGRHPALLMEAHDMVGEQRALCAAALLAMAPPVEAWSPWEVADGWRLNGVAMAEVWLRVGGGAVVRVEAARDGAYWRLRIGQNEVRARLEQLAAGDAVLAQPGGRTRLRLVRVGQRVTVIDRAAEHEVEIADRLAPPEEVGPADARLTAPTPARVVAVLVREGDVVKKGQTLLVLEAMKVETKFTAPRSGKVTKLNAQENTQIAEGTTLLELEDTQ